AAAGSASSAGPSDPGAAAGWEPSGVRPVGAGGTTRTGCRRTRTRRRTRSPSPWAARAAPGPRTRAACSPHDPEQLAGPVQVRDVRVGADCVGGDLERIGEGCGCPVPEDGGAAPVPAHPDHVAEP